MFSCYFYISFGDFKLGRHSAFLSKITKTVDANNSSLVIARGLQLFIVLQISVFRYVCKYSKYVVPETKRCCSCTFPPKSNFIHLKISYFFVVRNVWSACRTVGIDQHSPPPPPTITDFSSLYLSLASVLLFLCIDVDLHDYVRI
jgi:hypothetical protein